MDEFNQTALRPPYLILIGDEDRPAFVKTGFGIVQWCPDRVAGQLRFEGNSLSLGVPDMTVHQAMDAGVNSLVIGVAPVGGTLADNLATVLREAARAGLDIVSGLHLKLEGIPGLARAAMQSGASLLDVRKPPAELPVGTGASRTGKRLLMVGTDCAVGKKYTALALTQALRNRSIDATFRATGQTGIIISGTGIPIDSVVADFLAGAAEVLSPENAEDHWDVIEGQGSLLNPSYAGVALGLLHGSQPDAIVVCHDPSRGFISSAPHIPMPSLAECIELNLRCGRLTSPDIRCVGVSVNTSGLPGSSRLAYREKLSIELGVPCVDPIIDGCDILIDHLLHLYPAYRPVARGA